MQDLSDFVKSLIAIRALDGIGIRVEKNSKLSRVKMYYEEKQNNNMSRFVHILKMSRGDIKTRVRFDFFFQEDEEFLFNKLDEIVKVIPKSVCHVIVDKWDPRWYNQSIYSFSLNVGDKRQTVKFVRSLIS